MNILKLASFACIVAIVTAKCLALGPSQIPDRATLHALIGNNAMTDGFENLIVPAGAIWEFGPVLNSSTVFLGRGPGIVIPGFTFRVPVDSQILPPDVNGGDSQRLCYSSGSPLIFEFSPPVKAVGVDVFTVKGSFSGNPFVQIFDSAGEDVGSFRTGLVNSFIAPRFFGVQNEGGISRIVMSSFIGGPAFDNLTFGNLVPEPTSAVISVMGVAMLAMGRRMFRCQSR